MGLELAGVVKRFGDTPVVSGATLEVAKGEIVALLGPSGCGKTTTLRLIAGFEQLDGGRIVLEGDDLSGLPTFRRGIGLVFQDYALFPHMTVADNIAYGMKQRGIGRAERAAKIDELLRLVRLEGLGGRRPTSLSGGQQQRVALARALAIEPRLLLLDEPLSNLDAKLREDLRTELREILVSLHLTTLVVTHDQQEAIGLSDRIAVMNKGVIEQIGTAREIYEEPATRFVGDFVGKCIWFEGSLDSATQMFRTNEGLALQARSSRVTADPAVLAIRPEHLHVGARPGDDNRLRASVTRVEFFGAELLVTCQLDGTSRFVTIPMRSDDPEIPVSGAVVTLGVAAERCRVLPA
jgi:putative spermidine/putrescine transport system ATP-binding protein